MASLVSVKVVPLEDFRPLKWILVRPSAPSNLQPFDPLWHHPYAYTVATLLKEFRV